MLLNSSEIYCLGAALRGGVICQRWRVGRQRESRLLGCRVGFLAGHPLFLWQWDVSLTLWLSRSYDEAFPDWWWRFSSFIRLSRPSSFKSPSAGNRCASHSRSGNLQNRSFQSQEELLQVVEAEKSCEPHNLTGPSYLPRQDLGNASSFLMEKHFISISYIQSILLKNNMSYNLSLLENYYNCQWRRPPTVGASS